jgi:hypothetical protein
MDKILPRIEDEKDDGWGGLANIDGTVQVEDANEVVPEDQLPFEIMKLVEEDLEEDVDSIRTSMFYSTPWFDRY